MPDNEGCRVHLGIDRVAEHHGPNVAEHTYRFHRKMAVTALAYFSYSKCLTAEDDGNTAGMCLLNTCGLGKKMIVTACLSQLLPEPDNGG